MDNCRLPMVVVCLCFNVEQDVALAIEASYRVARRARAAGNAQLFIRGFFTISIQI